jgi:hypothetical protein
MRPMSEGLVLVGRRASLNDNSGAVRNPSANKIQSESIPMIGLLSGYSGLLSMLGCRAPAAM